MPFKKKTITFLLDYISPYAYLAWTQIHKLAEKYDHAVEPMPVLFAGLLNASGQKRPAEVPLERNYIIKNLYRTTSALGNCYNTTSVAFLTHMIAQQCGYEVGEIILSMGDLHLY